MTEEQTTEEIKLAEEKTKIEQVQKNLPDWWVSTYYHKKFNPRKRNKSPKRETGYYIIINGETQDKKDGAGKITEHGHKFSQRVDRFQFPVPTKRQTKKYDTPHVWPEKYKAMKAEEAKVRLAEKVKREKAAEKAKGKTQETPA